MEWVLPNNNTKGKKEHGLPLPEYAIERVKSLPKWVTYRIERENNDLYVVVDDY